MNAATYAAQRHADGLAIYWLIVVSLVISFAWLLWADHRKSRRR